MDQILFLSQILTPETQNHIFFGYNQLTLEGLDFSSGDGEYTPFTTNMRHVGEYALDSLADLPTDITFDATDEKFDVQNQIMLKSETITI